MCLCSLLTGFALVAVWLWGCVVVVDAVWCRERQKPAIGVMAGFCCRGRRGWLADAVCVEGVWCRSLLSEEGEVDAAVCAVGVEMWVGGEVVCFAVLEYEESVGCEDS